MSCLHITAHTISLPVSLTLPTKSLWIFHAYYTFEHLIILSNTHCCWLFPRSRSHLPKETAKSLRASIKILSCFTDYHKLPWWNGPQGKELRVTSSQQPTRNWSPQSNNPPGTEFCQQGSISFPNPTFKWDSSPGRYLHCSLWETFKQNTQLIHAWISLP